MKRLIGVAVLAASLGLLSVSVAGAASLEPIGEFKQPIYVTSDPGDANRLLVVEREGLVEEVAGGAVVQIADLRPLVACCASERGLLSIAPAPDFGSSGRFYAAYAGKSAAGGAEGDVHVDSFRLVPGGGVPVREPILSVGHAQEANHNGGQLQFGPDGHLYVSLGDGGGGGDPFENGQDTGSLLAKILRIDPQPGQVPAYSIPAGNPFAGGPGSAEIWAYGLRNPWRFSFDRTTGDMVIADVGQGAREEVDFAPSPARGEVGGAAANYGWNCREGFNAYSSPAPACGSASGFAEPVFDYPHADSGDGSAHGCSIIGGYVVRDPSLTGLYGRYLYADFCTEEIRSLALPSAPGGRASDDRSEGLTVTKPSSFGEDACGRLYVASGEGQVYRLLGAAGAACPLASSLGPTGASTGVTRKHRRIHLRLRAHPSRHRVRLTARVLPCAGHARDRVQLNRSGTRFASGRLNRKCVARFSAHLDGATTFRALLLGSRTIRSRRLEVEPRLRGRR